MFVVGVGVTALNLTINSKELCIQIACHHCLENNFEIEADFSCSLFTSLLLS